MKEKEEKYQTINHQINQAIRHYRVPSSVEKDAALNSVLHKIHTRSVADSRTIILPVWLRTSVAVAATVFVAFILWAVFSTQQINNEGKQVVSFRLPDQSRVVLATNSSVSFRKLLWNREIKLDGKAYFEVEKGKKFRVLASEGLVEVLGTRFLVDGNSDQMKVICFEGKVKASFRESSMILLPGSGVSLNEKENPAKFPEEESYPGFARFPARYNNAELESVVSDLEAFFGVRIDSQVTQKRYFTGSFDTGKLETALSIVTSSLELKYKILNDHSIRIY